MARKYETISFPRLLIYRYASISGYYIFFLTVLMKYFIYNGIQLLEQFLLVWFITEVIVLRLYCAKVLSNFLLKIFARDDKEVGSSYLN